MNICVTHKNYRTNSGSHEVHSMYARMAQINMAQPNVVNKLGQHVFSV